MRLRIVFLACCVAQFVTTAAMAGPSPDPDPPAPAPNHNLPLAPQQPASPEATAQSIEQSLPEIAELRQKVAALYGGSNELAAVPYLTREIAIGERIIRAARQRATDTQMHALIEYLDADGDILFSMIARHPADTGLATLGLSYTSARRTRFAREQFQEFSNWKAWVKQDQPALWQSLRQAQDRFTDLSVLPSFSGSPRMDLIRQQADTIGDLEKSIFDNGGLRREFSMGSLSDILADIGLDQLVANVNFGKVLIVYVLYDEVRSSANNSALVPGPSRYLAIVGHSGAPLAGVDLGPAEAIDDLEKVFLASLSTAPTDNTPFDKRTAEQLFQKIVAPLQIFFKYSDVNYGTSLLISADGTLLCIPFSALVDNGTFLIDKYQIAMLDSPADANLIARRNLAPATRFLALANPSPPIVLKEKVQPLVEAEHEADQIAALWPPGQRQILRQSAATPDALSADAANAGIVHIAGHGRFVASPIGLLKAQTISLDTIESDKTGLMASSLARSVIVLAPSEASGSTGFFSALDVLGLDLSHTQLVVLAACDSGIGDEERGEGIYGLRRSFLEAGAETVVNSLWSVDSAGTREMMVSFYRNLFQGQARGDALQHAAAFTRLKYPHPYYWAAFVITGNLGGLTLPKDN